MTNGRTGQSKTDQRHNNRLRGDSVSLALLLTCPRWSAGVLRRGPGLPGPGVLE